MEIKLKQISVYEAQRLNRLRRHKRVFFTVSTPTLAGLRLVSQCGALTNTHRQVYQELDNSKQLQ